MLKTNDELRASYPLFFKTVNRKEVATYKFTKPNAQKMFGYLKAWKEIEKVFETDETLYIRYTAQPAGKLRSFEILNGTSEMR